MKKKLLVFIFGILFIPLTAFAKEYNAFDIRFKEELGSNVKNNEIKVYCKVDDNENFVDHTADFTMEEILWYKYKSTKEEGKTEEDYDYYDEDKNVYGYLVTDDDVFEEEYQYFLYIPRLFAKEEDSFHRNVTINGIDIDEMDGTCYNAGNELLIKTKARGNNGTQNEDKPEEIIKNETDEETQIIDNGIVREDNTCMLEISLCCATFLGISICIWIIIAIILLLIIILIICIKSKNKKRNN